MTPSRSIETVQMTEAMGQTASWVLARPFDLAQSAYALAVRLGLIQNSLLGSARFARDISALEKMTLGPWARQV